MSLGAGSLEGSGIKQKHQKKWKEVVPSGAAFFHCTSFYLSLKKLKLPLPNSYIMSTAAMLTTTAQVPKNALNTSQLTFQQLQELAIATQLPPPPLTLHLPANTYRPPVSAVSKPVVERWAVRLEEDDTLPPFPASWVLLTGVR